ncbi:MAG: DUF1670 domain-containing protein [Chloroflexi bacterium]|nr:DUF1670 domain-containing protein [Chloroflexota bacterium]
MSSVYTGTRQRCFQQAARHLLETEYGFINSRRVIDMLAADMEALAAEFRPDTATVSPGWLVFTGTKACGGKAHPGKSAGDYPLVTLSWPVLLPEDVAALEQMPPGRKGRQQQRVLLKKRVQRVLEHGLQHKLGPVLLTCTDLGLMFGCTNGTISRLLIELRQETGRSLLTKGYYFDQGVRPTHKAEIVALYEQGMDEADIARHSNHAQSSVGRYLRDYERVKLLLRHTIPVDQIGSMSGLQPTVVIAYVKLIQQYHPDLLPISDLVPSGT